MVMFVSLVVIVALSIGLKNTVISSDFRLYFDKQNPQLIAFENLEAGFNKQDTLSFLVVFEQGVFAESSLRAVRDLVDASWKLPYVRKVSALTNYPRTQSSDEEIVSEELVSDEFIYSRENISEIENYTLNHAVASQYVSRDGEVTLINLSLSLPEDNANATAELVAAARQLVADQFSDIDGLNIQMMGTVIANISLQEAVEQDLSLIAPLSYLLVYVVLYLLLRSLSGVMITIGVITLSILAVLGAFGWLGGIVTPGVGSVPNMVMIIAVADCIHLLVSYYHYLRTEEKMQAIEKALRLNFNPMLVTSVTTAIGLLCLNFSESPPYRDLGNLVAFGAIVAFLLTVTFVPACLALLPVPKKIRNASDQGRLYQWMDRLGLSVSKNPIRYVIVASVVIVFFVAQLPKNELSDQWENYYDDTFDIKQAMKLQNEKFWGVRFIEYSVDAGEPQGIFSPSYMQDLASLTAWLRAQPGVGFVSTFSDPVKQIYMSLNGDDPAFYAIPDSKEMVAQSILLYEMSLPFGMGIEEQVNIDKSATRLSVQLHSLTSQELIALDNRIRQWAKTNAPSLGLSEGTGLDVVFANISQRNIESVVVGTAIALALISFILIFVFKSLKLGLISLIPNLVPAAMAYGAWGMFMGRIDLALSIVGTMSLGLVVDDTIHFLSKYRHARIELMQDVYGAIRYSFQTVGIAMLVTSIVLALGFGFLFLSHFSPTWGMGVLLATTIIFALVVDFLLLPGLLVLFDRKPYSNAELEKSTYG